MHNHYVYFLLDPRMPGNWKFMGHEFEFKPFYVGKGNAYRDRNHFYENSLNRDPNIIKVATIRKIQRLKLSPIIKRVVENISNSIAITIEKEAISHFGRLLDGGILTNICKSDAQTSANVVGKDNLHSKVVYQYSLDGKFIKKWDTSCRCVANELGIAQSSLARACKMPATTCSGFIWSYENLGEETEPIVVRDQQKRVKKILEITELGDIVKEYESAQSLADELEYHYASVHKAIRGCRKLKGKIYRYKTE